MATVTPERLCHTCNKAIGVYDCRGCHQTFCKKHVTEHNLELSKEMDNIIDHHDQLRQQLREQNTASSRHPLMEVINNWERDCVEEIRATAEKIRQDFLPLLSRNTESVSKQLETIAVQLRTKKETDDYLEKDLSEWLQALNKLKEQLTTPSSVQLVKINESTWLQRLTIKTIPVDSADRFDKATDRVKILDDGSVAEHDNQTGHAEVRGSNTYSTGVHRIHLKVEKMTNNQWMFWGIISQSTTIQANSYSSKSANGWAKNPKQVYLNGVNNEGYNNYQGDMIESDVLRLTLNCDNRMIELENERTKQKHSMPIDLNYCPFPWQLHINLYTHDDRIRILQ